MVGETVVYTLAAQDADAINKRRDDFQQKESGSTNSGFIGHTGNRVSERDTFPAIVVRLWGASVNLQVFLDGNDTYWATSVAEGVGPRTWQFLGDE